MATPNRGWQQHSLAARFSSFVSRPGPGGPGYRCRSVFGQHPLDGHLLLRGYLVLSTCLSAVLSSANDAAVALAERAGGTVEGFQRMFAATAADLGFADRPVLNDPAGLDGPQGVEGGNLVSARDLAIATRALLAQPTLAAIVATPIYYFTGPDGFHHRLTNHNYLFLKTYAGAIGVKTGYTARAGHCLIAAARRGGRTMLTVVLDSGNPTQAAKQLLDKGFATPVADEPTADQLPPVRFGVAAPADGPSSRRRLLRSRLPPRRRGGRRRQGPAVRSGPHGRAGRSRPSSRSSACCGCGW